jgi:hypothetical protein
MFSDWLICRRRWNASSARAGSATQDADRLIDHRAADQRAAQNPLQNNTIRPIRQRENRCGGTPPAPENIQGWSNRNDERHFFFARG